MSTFNGAKIKIDHAIACGRKIEIHYVFPDSFLTSFQTFGNRGRLYENKYFLQTHSGSRKTLLEMVTKYPAIKIKLIRSRVVGNKGAEFAILTFKSYNLLKGFVETLQISEAEIEQILANNVS